MLDNKTLISEMLSTAKVTLNGYIVRKINGDYSKLTADDLLKVALVKRFNEMLDQVKIETTLKNFDEARERGEQIGTLMIAQAKNFDFTFKNAEINENLSKTLENIIKHHLV